MCRLSTITLIVEKYTIHVYNMLLRVLIFQRNDDSVINQGRIIHVHTGTVHSVDYNESVLSLCLW